MRLTLSQTQNNSRYFLSKREETDRRKPSHATGPLGDQAITIAVETERNMPPLTHIHSHTGIIHTSTQYHANYDKTGGLGLCFDEIKLSSVETEISQFRSTAKKNEGS